MEKNKWFYAWLHIKEIREHRSSYAFVEEGEIVSCLGRLANPLKCRHDGKFDHIYKHITAALESVDLLAHNVDPGSPDFHFVLGFKGALLVLEYVAEQIKKGEI